MQPDRNIDVRPERVGASLDMRERIEQLLLEQAENGLRDFDAYEVAQAWVEEQAARGEYSGRVDDGDRVRHYEPGEYSATAIEIDFTEAVAYASRLLGERS